MGAALQLGEFGCRKGLLENIVYLFLVGRPQHPEQRPDSQPLSNALVPQIVPQLPPSQHNALVRRLFQRLAVFVPAVLMDRAITKSRAPEFSILKLLH